MFTPRDQNFKMDYQEGYDMALSEVQEIISNAGASIEDSFARDIINGAIQKIQALKTRFQRPRVYETKIME